MSKCPVPNHFESSSRYLQGGLIRIVSAVPAAVKIRHVRILANQTLIPLALVEHDVVPFVDTNSWVENFANGFRHHLRVLIPRELIRRTYDAVIEISMIVKNRPTTRSPSQEIDTLHESAGCRVLPPTLNKIMVDLEPGILISPNDNAWLVDVEKAYVRVLWRFCKQIMLD